MVGRLVGLKGAELLLHAIPKAASNLNRPLRLTIAGTGPEEAHLRDLATDLNQEVQFCGWLNQPQLTALMRESDLLAIPSQWPEPFGLVGLEAGCVGLPAVGYDVGGVRDWLTPGLSGELAPGDPPSIGGLADAIVRALQHSDHNERLRLGAWETSKRFDLSSHLTKLEAVFESVINGHPAFS